MNPTNDTAICAPDGDDIPWRVAEAMVDCGYPECAAKANARLIAAAPDLAEALDWLLASLDADRSAERYPGDKEERIELAKAAGRSALMAALGRSTAHTDEERA